MDAITTGLRRALSRHPNRVERELAGLTQECTRLYVLPADLRLRAPAKLLSDAFAIVESASATTRVLSVLTEVIVQNIFVWVPSQDGFTRKDLLAGHPQLPGLTLKIALHSKASLETLARLYFTLTTYDRRKRHPSLNDEMLEKILFSIRKQITRSAVPGRPLLNGNYIVVGRPYLNALQSLWEGTQLLRKPSEGAKALMAEILTELGTLVSSDRREKLRVSSLLAEIASQLDNSRTEHLHLILRSPNLLKQDSERILARAFHRP